MAQVRDAAFNPSSPHSSTGGAESYKLEATPETRLTVFSPDDNLSSARSNKLLASHNLNVPPELGLPFRVKSADGFRNASVVAEKDPFVSSTAVPKIEQKLSPTASSFRPVSVPLVAHGSLNSTPGSNLGFGANRQLFAPQSTAKFSNELGLSRCFIIYSVSGPVTIEEVNGYLAKLERLGSTWQGRRNAFTMEGSVYLHFTNIRDARNAHDNVQLGSPDWRAEYIPAIEFSRVRGPAQEDEALFDGQVHIIAFGQSDNMGAIHIETVVHTFLETQGEVFTLSKQRSLNDTAFRGVVEFCDTDVAVAVLHRFNGTTLGGVHLILNHGRPDVATATPQPLETHGLPYNPPRPPVPPVHNASNVFHGMGLAPTPQPANNLVASGRLGQNTAGFHAPQHYPTYPGSFLGVPPAGPRGYVLEQTPTRGHGASQMVPMSPAAGGMPIMAPLFTTPPSTPMGMQSGFTSPRNGQHYGHGRFDGRRQNAMRVHRTPYYNNVGHHNHVDVNRIREGIDVRTTIMLRNIPNKVDQAMLKRIVDESSWGKYDFMYLRIDFANDCNVGYAFVNFVDPLDIIDFVNARGNQRWNCFKSDKVAEISYATIQGKDCLVQKFRNSSVMLEAPHYRPKLYYTSNGPRPEMAGHEEPFPDPDNQSKMKRSCENAEHVGLFTPSSGQHFRDEQRRRRSQFDRGTRLAALEEYDYDGGHHEQQDFFAPH